MTGTWAARSLAPPLVFRLFLEARESWAKPARYI